MNSIRTFPLFAALTSMLLLPASLIADGPKDNTAENVRPIPPPGMAIPDDVRQKLSAEAASFSREIAALSKQLAKKPDLLALLPDVEIYHKAVDWALRYNQIYKKPEIKGAEDMLRLGRERLAQLRAGKAPWLDATGLVVRGYRSDIDGSVQPYGLIVPPGFVRGGAPLRLDFWFHGRGETLSELSFLIQRHNSRGQFTPPNTIVLHPLGRYSCANKFAGEVDLFEALAHAKKYYPIDDRRILVRGFSMGGAACWQFAVHYPGKWAAAAPGAGFSETFEFLKFFQQEELKPTWWERKLWHLYDCTDYAVNLYNLPTVAYSGELDRQKQAADIMEKALAAEGMKMTHLIGPGMGHRYHPDAIVEIDRRLNAITAKGKNLVPQSVKFQTYTLRYNKSHWVRFDELEEHWEAARVEAKLVQARNEVRADTKNVAAVTFEMPSGWCRLDPAKLPTVILDGQKLEGAAVETDLSWSSSFRKTDGKWQAADGSPAAGLRKRPGLQGPIDDAFMSSFLIVSPTGQPLNDKVGQWAKGELAHAQDHWQLQFRGIARTKADKNVSAEDIARHNLVLFGDPQSNEVLKRIAAKLPIRWDAKSVTVGGKTYSAADHAPALIFPNPLNPKRYVVLNSGFTYREYDYLNNARQIPRLPDWAVIDLNQPVTSQKPGGIADAGFFDEHWRVKIVKGE